MSTTGQTSNNMKPVCNSRSVLSTMSCREIRNTSSHLCSEAKYVSIDNFTKNLYVELEVVRAQMTKLEQTAEAAKAARLSSSADFKPSDKGVDRPGFTKELALKSLSEEVYEFLRYSGARCSWHVFLQVISQLDRSRESVGNSFITNRNLLSVSDGGFRKKDYKRGFFVYVSLLIVQCRYSTVQSSIDVCETVKKRLRDKSNKPRLNADEQFVEQRKRKRNRTKKFRGSNGRRNDQRNKRYNKEMKGQPMSLVSYALPMYFESAALVFSPVIEELIKCSLMSAICFGILETLVKILWKVPFWTALRSLVFHVLLHCFLGDSIFLRILVHFAVNHLAIQRVYLRGVGRLTLKHGGELFSLWSLIGSKLTSWIPRRKSIEEIRDDYFTNVDLQTKTFLTAESIYRIADPEKRVAQFRAASKEVQWYLQEKYTATFGHVSLTKANEYSELLHHFMKEDKEAGKKLFDIFTGTVNITANLVAIYTMTNSIDKHEEMNYISRERLSNLYIEPYSTKGLRRARAALIASTIVSITNLVIKHAPDLVTDAQHFCQFAFGTFSTDADEIHELNNESGEKWYDKVIQLTNDGMVLQSDCISQLKHLFANLVGSGLFPKWVYTGYNRHIMKVPHVATVDVPLLLLGVVNYVATCAKAFDNADSMAKFASYFQSGSGEGMHAKIIDLTNKFERVYVSTPGGGKDVSLAEFTIEYNAFLLQHQYYRAHEHGIWRFLPNYKKRDDSLKPKIAHMIGDLTVRYMALIAGDRIVPFAVFFVGKAGIGKTILTYLIAACYATIKGIEFNPYDVYVVDKLAEYYEGYANQSVIVYPEIGAQHKCVAQAQGDPIMQSFLQFVDGKKMPLNMAFQGKGKTFMNSPIGIADGNNFVANCHLTMAFPEAAMRRFHYVEVRVKPEFRQRIAEHELPGLDPAKAKGSMHCWDFFYHKFVPGTQDSTIVKKEERHFTGEHATRKFMLFMTEQMRDHFAQEEKNIGEAKASIDQLCKELPTMNLSIPEPVPLTGEELNISTLALGPKTEIPSSRANERELEVIENKRRLREARLVNTQNVVEMLEQEKAINQDMVDGYFPPLDESRLDDQTHPDYTNRAQIKAMLEEHFQHVLWCVPRYMTRSEFSLPSYQRYVWAVRMRVGRPSCANGTCSWEPGCYDMTDDDDIMNESRLGLVWDAVKFCAGDKQAPARAVLKVLANHINSGSITNEEVLTYLANHCPVQSPIRDGLIRVKRSIRESADILLAVVGSVAAVVSVGLFFKRLAGDNPEDESRYHLMENLLTQDQVHDELGHYNYIAPEVRPPTNTMKWLAEQGPKIGCGGVDDKAQLEKNIRRNLWYVSVVDHKKKGVAKDHPILFVRGVMAIMNAHTLDNMLKLSKREGVYKYDCNIPVRIKRTENVGYNGSIDFSEGKIVSLGPDVIMVSVGSQDHYDLSSHFLDESALSLTSQRSDFNGATYRFELARITKPMEFESELAEFVPPVNRTMWVSKRLEQDEEGKCGHVFYGFRDGKWFIQALHCAGKPGLVFAEPISLAEHKFDAINLECHALSLNAMKVEPKPFKGIHSFDYTKEGMYTIEPLCAVDYPTYRNKTNIKVNRAFEAEIRDITDATEDIQFDLAKLNRFTEMGVVHNRIAQQLEKYHISARGYISNHIPELVTDIWMKRAAKELIKRGEKPPKMYNIYQAVNGIVNDSAFKRMNLSTSAGFGFPGKKRAYTTVINISDAEAACKGILPEGESIPDEFYVELDPVVASEVYYNLKCWERGLAHHAPKNVVAKDEPRPLQHIPCETILEEILKQEGDENVEIQQETDEFYLVFFKTKEKVVRVPKKGTVRVKKARLFNPDSMDGAIASRMVLSPLYDITKRHPDVFMNALGINHKKDWKKLHKAMKWKKNVGASDASDFDTSYPQAIDRAAALAWPKLAKYLGCDDDYVKMVYRASLEDTISVMLFEQIMYLVYCSLPSGLNGTTERNCFKNIIAHMCCWAIACTPEGEHYEENLTTEFTVEDFFDFVCMSVLGDDNLSSTHEKAKEYFNMVTCSRIHASFGVKYTNSLKQAISEPFIDLSEAEFLKRRFREHPKLGMVGPLEPQSLYKMLMFTAKPQDKSKTIYDVMKESSSMCLEELCLHYDEEGWNEKRKKMIKFVSEYTGTPESVLDEYYYDYNKYLVERHHYEPEDVSIPDQE